jgi:hypothetical protein
MCCRFFWALVLSFVWIQAWADLLPPGYSKSARIEVKRNHNFYIHPSFIYWQAIQEDMDLAVSAQNITATPTAPIREKVIPFEFQYEPGFKIAAGMNYDLDGWDSFLEYTWYHTPIQRVNANASPGETFFAIISSSDLTTLYTQVERTWKLKMDFLDGMLSRTYLVGRNLVFKAVFGLRGAWIRQFDTSFFGGHVPTYPDFKTATTFDYKNKTINWGIGPKLGIKTEWMFGRGMQMFGYGSMDILYTRFNQLLKAFSTGDTDSWYYTSEQINLLRPHLELEGGFSYNTYLSKDEWHWNLSASYGFQIFWSQKMYTVESISPLPRSNLFISGLTISSRVDF